MEKPHTSSEPGPAVNPAGGVRRDDQGNAVWEWAASTGRQALESTSRLLRKLEVPGLKLLDDTSEPETPAKSGAAKKGYPDTAAPKEQMREQSFDPYARHDAKVVKPARNAPPKVRAPVRRPSLLSRLFGRR